MVHVLLAWSSAPIRAVRAFVFDTCTAHDVLTLFPSDPGNKTPLLEVRNLGMQSCAIWNSAYRLGPYVSGETIDRDWLERSHLRLSDFTAKDDVGVRESKPADRESAILQPDSDVEYLRASFESGYSGYFELLLKVPSPVIVDCPFRILRRREADGQTTIYLSRCDGAPGKPTPQPGIKGIRLVLRSFGLLPERPGRVEYDVVTSVLRGRRAALAYANTELSVRDPRQAMLPAIDSSTPGCQVSQLKLTSPPAELGSHWSRPRNYAPAGAGSGMTEKFSK